nr:prolyl oligopeptidase family serine peptidase [Acetobacter pomorum]
MNNISSSSVVPMPCGTWPSPVTPDLVAGKTLSFAEIRAVENTVFWLERRPAEAGRSVLMRWTQAEGATEALASDTDVATRVHEYGGGAYAVKSGCIAYSDKRTGNVWLRREEDSSAIFLAGEVGLRFADLQFDVTSETVLAVREDHRADGEAQTTLVALHDQADKADLVLKAGADFYAAPTFSPDGALLAWIEWDHPNMPWDATRLCLARVQRNDSGAISGLQNIRVLAGENTSESLIQPQWTSDGHLLVLSDRSGSWTIWNVEWQKNCPTLSHYPVPEGEVGQPAWVFGQRSYQPLENGGCLALAVTQGQATCWIKPNPAENYSIFHARPDQCPVPLGDGRFAWLQAPADALPSVVVGTPNKGVEVVLRQSSTQQLDVADISIPESIRFLVDGEEGLWGHAFFYAPTNAHACVPKGELPPMIVQVHGGPTARAQEGLSFKIQWWTSRGFAVLDVNYGGSTGFGRAWRNRLKGQWGVVDVADCLSACRAVVESGRVDPNRMAIRGSSAGGMTVLVALAVSDIFAAGVSLYGVTDLRALAQETHKFEARYLDGLIGPWPEAEALYLQRSPISVADQIRAPVLLLQGMDDKVVPPEQAYSMAKALKAAGTPVTLREFEGEGHGFRKEATVLAAFAAELDFYAHVFGFTAQN